MPQRAALRKLNRLEWLREKHRGKTVAEKVFDEAVETDPTPNKMYLQWILKLVGKGDLLPEDFRKTKSDLAFFHAIKKSLPEKKRDINFHKTISIDVFLMDQLQRQDTFTLSMLNLLDEWGDRVATESSFVDIEAMKDEARKIHESNAGAAVVVDDGEHMIVRLDTHEAARILGQGTRWCTSDSEKWFWHYRKTGALHILLDVSDAHQAHLPSGQLMDNRDIAIHPYKFWREKRIAMHSLAKIWLESGEAEGVLRSMFQAQSTDPAIARTMYPLPDPNQECSRYFHHDYDGFHTRPVRMDKLRKQTRAICHLLGFDRDITSSLLALADADGYAVAVEAALDQLKSQAAV